MFISTFENKLDKKGRVSVPAPYRININNEGDNNIVCYPSFTLPAIEFCPKKRKNFLSYSYVLHKFVELLDLPHLKPLFPLLKSREKLHQQDQIWQKICERVGWTFHKSM